MNMHSRAQFERMVEALRVSVLGLCEHGAAGSRDLPHLYAAELHLARLVDRRRARIPASIPQPQGGMDRSLPVADRETA